MDEKEYENQRLQLLRERTLLKDMSLSLRYTADRFLSEAQRNERDKYQDDIEANGRKLRELDRKYDRERSRT